MPARATGAGTQAEDNAATLEAPADTAWLADEAAQRDTRHGTRNAGLTETRGRDPRTCSTKARLHGGSRGEWFAHRNNTDICCQ